MKYIDEYRDPGYIEKIKSRISTFVSKREIRLMEVCGTHTMAIHRFGLHLMLPENVKMLSGPGCPVCVTENSYIDTAICYAEKGFIITTFGDMFRVPGSYSSLEEIKANGGKVEIVYSPFDSLMIAKRSPDIPVVFLSVGFETTAPGIASTVLEARKQNINNFYILPGNKLVPPALEVLLKDNKTKVDGFILPGHVSTIIGKSPYMFISDKYKVSSVISGFEPLDIVSSFVILLEMIHDNSPQILNNYKRAVRNNGNPKAVEIMCKVFQECDVEWRGIGKIKDSGLRLKDNFKEMDVRNKYPIEIPVSKENPLCRCGDILKGVSLPQDCPIFGNACTPDHPVGPCMVSSEGTCSAHYKYG